jgi:predicted DNA binding CopG/RHH family protein
MRKEYDFTNAKKNPYAKKLKQQVTILLDKEAVAYFKKLAAETGVAYQVLINLYLKECARMKKRLSFGTEKPSRATKKTAA